MLTRSLAVAAALCAAEVVCGQTSAPGTFQFVATDVFLGGAGNPAQPISVVGGTFYQDPNGSDFPPDPVRIGGFPTVEFDSYIALDSIGPSTINRAAAAPDGVVGFSFTASSLTGRWFSTAGVLSSPAVFGNLQSVFIARLAITQGGVLNAPNLAATVISEQFGQQIIRGPLSVVPPGGALTSPSDRGGGAAYDFRAISSFGSGLLTSPLGGSRAVALQIFDLYIVAIPTPGTLAILAGASVFLARRRR